MLVRPSSLFSFMDPLWTFFMVLEVFARGTLSPHSFSSLLQKPLGPSFPKLLRAECLKVLEWGKKVS